MLPSRLHSVVVEMGQGAFWLKNQFLETPNFSKTTVIIEDKIISVPR